MRRRQRQKGRLAITHALSELASRLTKCCQPNNWSTLFFFQLEEVRRSSLRDATVLWIAVACSALGAAAPWRPRAAFSCLTAKRTTTSNGTACSSVCTLCSCSSSSALVRPEFDPPLPPPLLLPPRPPPPPPPRPRFFLAFSFFFLLWRRFRAFSICSAFDSGGILGPAKHSVVSARLSAMPRRSADG